MTTAVAKVQRVPKKKLDAIVAEQSQLLVAEQKTARRKVSRFPKPGWKGTVIVI